MGVLGEQIKTNAWILLAAGLIMILALRFSKKAQSVTETELNLARQSDGNERFKPSGFLLPTSLASQMAYHPRINVVLIATPSVFSQ